MADQRPAVFVGSSTEGLPVAQEVELHLKDQAELTIWKHGFFRPGFGTLETLTDQLDDFDFAIIVLSPDDKLTFRGKGYTSPRDNILFELGLFMGHLGRGRTFIVHAEGGDLKLPSDLAGITMCPYRGRDNLSASLSPTCTLIMKAIRSLGLRECHRTPKLSQVVSDSTPAWRLYSYKCPQSENSARGSGIFRECANRSTSAKYLVLRGRDILSSGGEIALMSRNAGPHLRIQLLMVDFETLSNEKFDEAKQHMDLLWDKTLDAEKQLAIERLAFATNLSKRNGSFQCRLLPRDMVPELKLRLYDHCGFFAFYRKRTGWDTPVQKRPIFCVEDQDPSKFDNSPLRITLDRWYDELWDISRKPL